ncbi:MAG: S41 family peptidase [Bryobacteraceae bacterium]
MARLLAAFACVTAGLVCHAQDLSGLAEILNFEAPSSNSVPAGWSANPPGSVFLDDKIVHGGHWSARLERQAGTANAFSGIVKSLPMDVAGTAIELRGFIRTEGVSDFAALWVREDDASNQSLAFDSLQRLHVTGTTDWTEYSVSVPVNPDARRLFFGFLLAGTGKAWVDDMRLLVNDKPIWDAPKVVRETTVLDTDHEFDDGSKIALAGLSAVQIENLATLGKVWGFLKYHHPQVTSGQRHWDYELFRILPAILDAPDHAAANAVLAKWVAALGKIGDCQPCSQLDEKELQLRPDLTWIDSEDLLGSDLSRMLQAIYRNRPANGKQFYVSMVPGIGNPAFQHELGYTAVKLPDAGLQLLALFRFWNIVEYWFPSRDLIGENWDRVLAEFIPRIALAKTAEDYERELMALIARIHDTHANLWSAIQVRPPMGDCRLAVTTRFIESSAVVTGYADAPARPATGLRVGDAIEALDGVPVPRLIEKWKPYYADSNDAAMLRDMAASLGRGECGDAKLMVRRANQTLDVAAKRAPPAAGSGGRMSTHDLPGDTFRRLSDDVAYLKLSSVKTADAAHYVDGAAGTKGLIIDIRNYPSEFMVFSLGSLVVDKETPFVRFTVGDLSNPGAFHFDAPLSITPVKPHYGGKIVILVDEVTQSSAEYTSMAFRAAPNAVVIGSTTAGADGNVSQIALPGGQSTMISGLGVFYPDKRPTQRVGIVPDLVVKPTIAGIRAGRDEVLEAAIRQILGPGATAAVVEKLAKGDKE